MSEGLFEQAERAKIEVIKAQYYDRLSMVVLDEYMSDTIAGETLTRETMMERLEEEKAGRETWIDIIRKDSRDERKVIVISKEGYAYDVIVEDDGSSYVEKREEENLPELEEANIEFTCTPNDWTNGNVVAEVKTNIEGFVLQYSTNRNKLVKLYKWNRI